MYTSKPLCDLHVVCIGEALWDIVGSNRLVGGAPLNFAHHASCLGAKSHLISRVSQDDLGAELLQQARLLEIDLRFVQRELVHSTGLVKAEPHSDGTVTYQFPEETAWDHIQFAERERELIDQASIIYFGTLAQRSHVSRSSIMAAIASAPANAMVLCDLNLRAPHYSPGVIGPSLNAANVVKMSEGELALLQGLYQLPVDEEAALTVLRDSHDLEAIVVTRGQMGALAVSRTASARVSGKPVNVVDTIGCGDAFAAAFALHLIQGRDLQTTLEYANVAGSFVAAHRGATPQYDTAGLDRFREENHQLPGPANAASAG